MSSSDRASTMLLVSARMDHSPSLNRTYVIPHSVIICLWLAYENPTIFRISPLLALGSLPAASENNTLDQHSLHGAVVTFVIFCCRDNRLLRLLCWWVGSASSTGRLLDSKPSPSNDVPCCRIFGGGSGQSSRCRIST